MQTCLLSFEAFSSYLFSAERARAIRLQPRYDALRVEVVGCVAGERRNFIVFLEGYHADCTLGVFLEIFCSVVTPHERIDHVVSLILSSSHLPLVVSYAACEAGGAEDKHEGRPCH